MKTKVYLLVMAEVDDETVVSQSTAAVNAAKTLSELIYEGMEDVDERGMILFQRYGNVRLGGVSVLFEECAENMIQARKRRMSRE